LVAEDPSDLFTATEDPRDTRHHSEQRLIVSREWLAIRQEVINEIKALLSVGGPLDLPTLAAAISPIVATISINRSSCYTCNGFLVAELVSLWREIATAVGGEVPWQAVRDALVDVLEFEISYSIPYSGVSDVEVLDQQLEAAGWVVYPHSITYVSEDEGEHERLSLGGGVSKEVKKEQRGSGAKKRRKKVNPDEESYEESEQEEAAQLDYELVTHLSRRFKLEKALHDFFHRLARSKRGKSALQILTQDLGFGHHAMPGDGLNCALYSILDQLERRFNIRVVDRDGFIQFVRERAQLAFGTMIDVLNNGGAVLTAVQQYLVQQGLAAADLHLVVDVWSATAEGVIEFQNVAQGGGAGAARILTLYYNGVSHFDSLSGGLSR
jgi:hypothetical protein